MNLFKKVKNKQTEPLTEDEPKAPDVKGQEVALTAPIDLHSVEDQIKIDWLRGQMIRKERRTCKNQIKQKLASTFQDAEVRRRENLSPVEDNSQYLFDTHGRAISRSRQNASQGSNFSRLLNVPPYKCSEEVTVEKPIKLQKKATKRKSGKSLR